MQGTQTNILIQNLLTASCLGLVLDLIILLAPLQELLLAPRGLNMLNTHMDSLGHDPAIMLQKHGPVRTSFDI